MLPENNTKIIDIESLTKFLENIIVTPLTKIYNTIIHVNLKIILIVKLQNENGCYKFKLQKPLLYIMNERPVKKGDILKIYVDGASRGNPGPAASAFLIVHNDKIILDRCVFIGTATNNTAEYQAIINALKAAEKFSQGHIQVYSDSNLAIQQINKKWKINYPHLSKMCSDVYKLCEKYEKVEFFHVGRNNPYILKCDKLCNERLDAEGFRN